MIIPKNEQDKHGTSKQKRRFFVKSSLVQGSKGVENSVTYFIVFSGSRYHVPITDLITYTDLRGPSRPLKL